MDWRSSLLSASAIAFVTLVMLATLVVCDGSAAYADPATGAENADTLSAQPADAPAAPAQSGDARSRPFVANGIYDRPFMTSAGRTRFGGYAETNFRFEREDGVTEELSFLLPRLNLFAFAPVSERVRLAAEIEFEEGGEEITIELAIIDLEIHDALTFRGGIILSPLGRFNVAHDSPANELNDRPLVSTELIGAALSEPGMGALGAFYPSSRARITYELYAVNGFDNGVLIGSEGGTRIAEGKGNFEDNNAHPSVVGRVAVSPMPALEVGMSAHAGPYNVYERDGLDVDERRDVTIAALDWSASSGRFELLGEAARTRIDVPANLSGIVASEQRGLYAEASARFLEGAIATLPSSRFAAVSRYDVVDFDEDLSGDSVQRVTTGVNFRPTSDTVFKLDYQYNWLRDRFNVEARSAGIVFGVATYF